MIQTFNKIGSRITAARCDLEAGPKMRIANRELAAVGGVVHRDDAARYRFAAVVGMQSESKPNAGRDAGHSRTCAPSPIANSLRRNPLALSSASQRAARISARSLSCGA